MYFDDNPAEFKVERVFSLEEVLYGFELAAVSVGICLSILVNSLLGKFYRTAPTVNLSTQPTVNIVKQSFIC